MPFVIDIGLQKFEKTFPNSSLRPIIETIEDCLPRAKLLWQITPRHTGATPPQYGFKEISIVVARTAGTSSRREKILDFDPHSIGQHHAQCHLR